MPEKAGHALVNPRGRVKLDDLNDDGEEGLSDDPEGLEEGVVGGKDVERSEKCGRESVSPTRRREKSDGKRTTDRRHSSINQKMCSESGEESGGQPKTEGKGGRVASELTRSMLDGRRPEVLLCEITAFAVLPVDREHVFGGVRLLLEVDETHLAGDFLRRASAENGEGRRSQGGRDERERGRSRAVD